MSIGFDIPDIEDYQQILDWVQKEPRLGELKSLQLQPTVFNETQYALFVRPVREEPPVVNGKQIVVTGDCGIRHFPNLPEMEKFAEKLSKELNKHIPTTVHELSIFTYGNTNGEWNAQQIYPDKNN